ncbi:MAG TPA: hypothetical protein VIG99_11820 [Myxococcaceae bacterium]
MNHRQSGSAAGIFLAVLALASCGPVRDPAPLATAQEPLFACGSTIHYNGNLFGPWDSTQTVGCACGAGFQRTNATASSAGTGFCNIVGFTTSDPNDCRVNVHIHVEAWPLATGDCFVTVNKDPRPDSCVTRCGGSAPTCWCDSLCTGFGDCCSDYTGVCMSAIELRLQSVTRSPSDGLLHLSVANNGRRGTVQQVVCTVGTHTVARTVNTLVENGHAIDVTLNGYYGAGNYSCGVAGISDNGAAETFLDNNNLLSFIP